MAFARTSDAHFNHERRSDEVVTFDETSTTNVKWEGRQTVSTRRLTLGMLGRKKRGACRGEKPSGEQCEFYR